MIKTMGELKQAIIDFIVVSPDTMHAIQVHLIPQAPIAADNASVSKIIRQAVLELKAVGAVEQIGNLYSRGRHGWHPDDAPILIETNFLTALAAIE